MQKRVLLALAALGLSLGLGACGFPQTPNDGQVHIGTAIHASRQADTTIQVCPPLCGDEHRR